MFTITGPGKAGHDQLACYTIYMIFSEFYKKTERQNVENIPLKFKHTVIIFYKKNVRFKEWKKKVFSKEKKGLFTNSSEKNYACTFDIPFFFCKEMLLKRYVKI